MASTFPPAPAAPAPASKPGPSPFPDDISPAHKYGPALLITGAEEARAYFELCVEHTLRTSEVDRQAAERIERENIGYWGGYGTFEQRQRMERLFGAVHPVFGSTERGPVTAEQAMALGQRWGLESLGRRSS